MAGLGDMAKMYDLTPGTFRAVFDAIKDRVERGEKVRIKDFGTFQMKTRAARTARNPRTGEEVKVPEKTVLTFKAS